MKINNFNDSNNKKTIDFCSQTSKKFIFRLWLAHFRQDLSSAAADHATAVNKNRKISAMTGTKSFAFSTIQNIGNIILYYTILYYTILHYTILYYTTLY